MIYSQTGDSRNLSRADRPDQEKNRIFPPRPATFSGLRREGRPAILDKATREVLVNSFFQRRYSIANPRPAVYTSRNYLDNMKFIDDPGRTVPMIRREWEIVCTIKKEVKCFD